MSPAPVFVRIPGSHHPGIRLRLIPGFRDPGSVLILGQVTQYGNPYLICIASLVFVYQIELSIQKPMNLQHIAMHNLNYYFIKEPYNRKYTSNCHLTHWGRVTHICVSQLITIVSDNDYLKQWWNIVIWTRGKKFKGNLNRNLYIFIQENAFENVVWKMSAILSRPQCVKQ